MYGSRIAPERGDTQRSNHMRMTCESHLEPWHSALVSHNMAPEEVEAVVGGVDDPAACIWREALEAVAIACGRPGSEAP